MRFAQIYANKAHWIFEADKNPEFAPNIVLVDITDKPEVQEHWNYNSKTGEFTPPIEPEYEEPEHVETLDERVVVLEDTVTEIITKVYE